jgi:adenylate kinase family enzyme
MRRVLVLGSGGAGKSTFARALGERTGLPVVHLDRHWWRPGWVESPKAEFEADVAELIARDAWVMDGNYAGTLPARLAAADTAVFLDVPRVTCLFRVIVRALRHRGRTRLDMPPDCPERLEWEFVQWIWTYPALRRPGVLAMLTDFERRGGRAAVLRTSAQARAFLEEAGPSRANS